MQPSELQSICNCDQGWQGNGGREKGGLVWKTGRLEDRDTFERRHLVPGLVSELINAAIELPFDRREGGNREEVLNVPVPSQ